jgi:hypothetical protein
MSAGRPPTAQEGVIRGRQAPDDAAWPEMYSGVIRGRRAPHDAAYSLRWVA